MSSAEELPRDLMDRIIRRTLPAPPSLRAFLRRAVPSLAGGFVYERARLLEREIIGADWRRRESDLPFEIPFRTSECERTALVYVLVEHQSDTDVMVPLRLLHIVVGYWGKQREDWLRLPPPRPPFQLHPVLPIVLYTGPLPWGSNRTILDMLGEPAAFHGFAPAWQPIFWNLADQTPEELLRTGEEWFQMLAVFRAEHEDAEEFRAVFAEAVRGFAKLQGSDEVRWADFLRSVLAFAFQRRPAAERTTLRVSAEEANPVRTQEVQTMTRTIAEALRDEGRAEGAVETARAMLRKAVEHRFGELPEPIVRQIEDSTDVDRLQAAVIKVFTLEKPEDFSL